MIQRPSTSMRSTASQPAGRSAIAPAKAIRPSRKPQPRRARRRRGRPGSGASVARRASSQIVSNRMPSSHRRSPIHKGAAPTIVEHYAASHAGRGGEQDLRRELFFDHALLPDGWARDVRISVADGRIVAVAAGATRAGADRLAGITLPGVPNLHSHAFQRGMAGLAERRGPDADSFWTWREVMYRFLAAADARRRRGDRRLRLCGDAGGGLHHGRRVPLSAS